MIKYLGLLFSFTLLYSGETIYILPDQHSYCVHQLSQAIKNASGHILVISPSFNHSELKKVLLQAAKRGEKVTIIVKELHKDPLSMVQYDHINLNRASYTFENSTLIIDDTLVCTFSGAIEKERLKSTRSYIRCSDEQKKIELVRRSLNPLIEHSKPYLE
jgi:hypothetical protein